MSEKRDIFSENIELSEIVKSKANQAFEKIRMEDIDHMAKQENTNRKLFKTHVAAAACAGILAVSGISAVAAVHHYWGRGMQGNLQASDTQQQQLTDEGIATVFSESPDYESLAVTDNGVTIKPGTVIVDERYAYMTFNISGFSVADGEEPGFDTVEVYQGDNPEAEDAWVNMSGSMYSGIISDENGNPVYEDGSALETDEDGGTILHYTDANGNMEYMIQAGVVGLNDSMLGKTIHVNFKNLGTLSKAQFNSVVDGNWDFTIKLSDVSSAKDIQVGETIEGTGFVLDNINISPVSMQINYSVNEIPGMNEDDLGIPEVKGVVLKDGTRIPYLTDGGGTGYTDETMKSAYQISGYDRVIDVDQVAALIVWTDYDKEAIDIPIAE